MVSSTGVLTKRAVCFLDVLGFRRMLANRSLYEVAKKYDRFIDNQTTLNSPLIPNAVVPKLFPEHPQGKPYCQRFVFSDSIILIADGEDPLSCLKLLLHAWRLMQLAFAEQVPLRGAVAFGEIYIDQVKSIFIGDALTRAYELEEQQAWIGIAIDQAVEKAYPELFKENSNGQGAVPFLFRYGVPMKKNQSAELWTINWRWNLVVQKGTRSLFSTESQEDVVEKVDNSLRYAAAVIKSGKIYSGNESAMPVEVRCFWIGGQEPPFLHGDNL